MRWLFLGAGALGGYFGARLMEAGQDVTFLVRERRHAQLRKTGLVINSPAGEFRVDTPHCVESPDVGDGYDIVMLGCKAYDLPSAMDAIAPAVERDTAILPILNGMNHVDRLSERFDRGHVLGGVGRVSATLDSEGRIQQFSNFAQLTYGELDGSYSTRMKALEKAFRGAEFTADASDNVMQEMWEKWIFIAAMGGATCLMRGAISDIAEAGGACFTTGMLDEGAAIATANGFAPRPAQLQHMRAFLSDSRVTLVASMLRDVQRGARTESDHILNELIARAPADMEKPRLLGIAAACLRTYELIRSKKMGSDPN